MIFSVQSLRSINEHYVFSGEVNAVAHPCLQKPILREFWQHFSFESSSLTLETCDELVFSIGNTKRLPLDGHAYSICIEKDGVSICAESEQALLHGFMTLLDRFRAIDLDDGSLAIELDGCEIHDRDWVANKMVHFCIFPETELWELQRFVRFCGALKYTHIVLEFWGMLQLDCMRELSWSHGFTKEQIRPLIAEARDLGMEIIPMFNHWGHASAGRVVHAKHVVLDQNPALQTYFSEDGWCWDIRKPKVQSLLRAIRAELIELCGEGSYFHIGCDEAYNFELNEENMRFLCDFINGVGNELRAMNRRTIVWGDMALWSHPDYNPDNRYSCHAPSPEVESFLLSHLDKRLLIADWQYNAKHAPIETASVFVQAGFECVLCPWDVGREQMNAVTATVREQKLFGIMHTTWHTLTSGMPYVLIAAVGGIKLTETLAFPVIRTSTAALLRKVMPVKGDYRRAGTSHRQVYSKW